MCIAAFLGGLMELRMATMADKEAIENLWAYNFETKEDPFFLYYFNHCYQPEDILVAVESADVPAVRNGELIIECEEKIVGMIHLRPYVLGDYGDKNLRETTYFVGVATDPDFRNSGVGKTMLQGALRHLREKGHGMTMLMPSQAGFYQRYGWEIYCHQWQRKMTLEELGRLSNQEYKMRQITSVEEWPILDEVYRHFTKGVTGHSVRDEKQWKTLVGSVLAEGMRIVVAYTICENKVVPQGYMFYKLGEEEIFVSEMIYTKRSVQASLLGYLCQHRSQGSSVRWNEWQGDEGYVFYPNGKSGNETMPFMMARVIDVERAFTEVGTRGGRLATALNTFNMEEETSMQALYIRLHDELTPENSGVYALQGALISLGDRNPVSAKKLSSEEYKAVSEEEILSMDIGTLALLLMGKMSAQTLYEREERIQGEEKLIPLLEAAMPEITKPFINEWY